MKKRFLAALLCVVMVASMLNGCGKSNKGTVAGTASSSTTAPSSSTAASNSSTAPKSGEKAGDKVLTYWSIGTSEPDATILQYAVDQFNKTTKSGYTIKLVNYPNDNYKEKLTIAMSSGECPDIYTNWTGGPLIEYKNAGYAQPITDQIKKYGLTDLIMPAGIAQGSIDGQVYAIPILNIAIAGVYYNKDIFKKYNLSEPTTVSQLEAICDTLVKNKITPFALANASKWTGSMYFMGLATRYGGLDPFSSAYKGTGTFEDKCFEYAGTKIQDWVKKGYFPKGVNSLSFDDGQDKQLMYQETAAMMLQGSWETSTFAGDSKEFFAKVGWFPFPAVDGSSADTSIQIGTVGDIFMTFNCQGDKLDAAVEMAKHYYDDEAVKKAVEAGYLPPVKNIASLVSDGLSKKILDAAMKASSIQLWYDQYLPPQVSDTHQSTCQELFGLTMTPQEADSQLQKSMKDYLTKK